MAKMRAAKERKRLAATIEREPRRVPHYPFEVGVRNKSTGETAWTDLRSVRDAAKKLSLILKFY